MELFLSDNDGQVGSPFFHRNNTSISFHLKFPNKRLRAFFKKHTTFLQKAYYLFEKRSDGGIWAVIKSVLKTESTAH